MITSGISTLLLSVFVATTVVTAQNGCDPSQVESCVGEMKNLYSSEEGPIIVKNEEELKTLCRHQERALTCINNFVDRCLPEQHRNLYINLTSGVQEFVQEFCTENSPTRKVYVKHLSCFNKVADQVHHCSMKFTEWHNQYQTENPDKQSYLASSCCHFGTAMTCMKTVVQDGCPDEASELFNSMVHKITKQFSQVAQCDVHVKTDPSQCPNSSATWNTLSMSALAFAILTLVTKRT